MLGVFLSDHHDDSDVLFRGEGNLRGRSLQVTDDADPNSSPIPCQTSDLIYMAMQPEVGQLAATFGHTLGAATKHNYSLAYVRNSMPELKFRSARAGLEHPRALGESLEPITRL